MRLTEQARAALKQAIEPLVANATEVRVFGSRIDDTALGGDVDLFVEFAGKVDHPAALSAQIAVRASRALDGRSVDVSHTKWNVTSSIPSVRHSGLDPESRRFSATRSGFRLSTE
ncbi:MAG: DNA polymerase subunit beta [Rhodocyclaceae bacterium]|nr:MAG: DNA polymerase subunit beta [Rhodocyclaceae bacterium]